MRDIPRVLRILVSNPYRFHCIFAFYVISGFPGGGQKKVKIEEIYQ